MEGSAAPPLPQQRFQGVQKESAGYRLLASMGWREGEGLGASKQGITEHIRVKKNFENWGVGAVTAAERARDWTTGMHDFHRVLSTLSEVTSQHARGGSVSSSSSGGEEERSEASDGPAARRAEKRRRRTEAAAKAGSSAAAEKEDGTKKKKKKKKKGKEKKAGKVAEQPAAGSVPTQQQQQPQQQQEDSSSGSEPEAPQQPQRAKRVATHLGRFKRREAAKMVRGYSSKDLEAILGGVSTAAVAPVQHRANELAWGAGPAAVVRAASEEPEEAPESSAARGKPAAAPAACPPTPPPGHSPADEGSWWRGQFHRAAGGGVGAAQAPGTRPALTVRGFREEDQEGLYNLVHENATKGRVGLGRAGMPAKVAGERWAGTKTRLGSGSEDEGVRAEPLDVLPTEEPAADPDGIVIIMPRSRAAGAPAASTGPPRDGGGAGEAALAAAVGGSSALAGIKWKKVASAALAGAGADGVKLSRLLRQVMSDRGLAAEHKPQALAGLTAAVSKSSRFVVSNGVVRAA